MRPLQQVFLVILMSIGDIVRTSDLFSETVHRLTLHLVSREPSDHLLPPVRPSCDLTDRSLKLVKRSRRLWFRRNCKSAVKLDPLSRRFQHKADAERTDEAAVSSAYVR